VAPVPEEVFAALHVQRLQQRHDQQVVEWTRLTTAARAGDGWFLRSTDGEVTIIVAAYNGVGYSPESGQLAAAHGRSR